MKIRLYLFINFIYNWRIDKKYERKIIVIPLVIHKKSHPEKRRKSNDKTTRFHSEPKPKIRLLTENIVILYARSSR